MNKKFISIIIFVFFLTSVNLAFAEWGMVSPTKGKITGETGFDADDYIRGD
tara:strand:- start:1128 stop:1280 length:153 start_codon:yes stop_codon:yes gene_type:complete